MNVKEFEAVSLRDCLQQVRDEMGPEAVILETRKLRKGGVMGLGSRDIVRIVAATGIEVTEPGDRSAIARQVEAAYSREVSGSRAAVGLMDSVAARGALGGAIDDSAAVTRGRSERVEAILPAVPRQGDQAEVDPLRPASTARPATSARVVDYDTELKLARLDREIRELKAGMAAIRQAATPAAPTRLPERGPSTAASGGGAGAASAAVGSQASRVPHPELYARLVRNEVPVELAEELMRSMPDMRLVAADARPTLAESALRELFARRVKAGGAISLERGKRTLAAFVGPTGAGKTTTVAKLAAQLSIVENRRVGLLTMDTGRVGAAEHLTTYGQILDVPVAAVGSPAEVGLALERLGACEVVLIDTVGRSFRSAVGADDLKALVGALECETHLVLSATTKHSDLVSQIAGFSSIGVNSLLFTKLDETTTYGTMLAAAASSGVPVSYVTTGQSVPEDIQAATAELYAKLALV